MPVRQFWGGLDGGMRETEPIKQPRTLQSGHAKSRRSPDGCCWRHLCSGPGALRWNRPKEPPFFFISRKSREITFYMQPIVSGFQLFADQGWENETTLMQCQMNRLTAFQAAYIAAKHQISQRLDECLRCQHTHTSDIALCCAARLKCRLCEYWFISADGL